MAASKTRRKKRERGGTVLGFLAGLVFGLGVAVVVAIFVTRAPVPFVNRTSKVERPAEPRSAADAPDPNRPLYSKNRPAADPAPVAAARPAPAPVPAPTASSGGLAPATAPAAPALPPGGVNALTPPSVAPVDPGPGRVADADREDKVSYVLQAGAFRSQDDADVLKARLALIGYEARVMSGDVNGQTLYRVRVGPYAQLDDMNRVRSKLAESGIEASVVRQR